MIVSAFCISDKNGISESLLLLYGTVNTKHARRQNNLYYEHNESLKICIPLLDDLIIPKGALECKI